MTVSPPLPRERDVGGKVDGRRRLADHDANGVRYCQATQAQALPSNSICRDQ
jgi:hypothetical protein